MAQAAGYVIQAGKNLFVSRSGRFVKHKKRSKTEGIQRAYVHSKDFVLGDALKAILEEGDWYEEAVLIYPAHFDTELELTVLSTGSVMSYKDFLETFKQPVVA